MTQHDQQKLGKILWNIADDLRGSMNADDFRDYMLAFLFLRYLSRYVSTAEPEPEVDLADAHQDLVSIENDIQEAAATHNKFLKELGLPPLPGTEH